MSGSGEAEEALESWERMMACCFPCGFVWFKEGCGGACCLNICLGCFLSMCCVNICHACGYVGKPGEENSPCNALQVRGPQPSAPPITMQPKV